MDPREAQPSGRRWRPVHFFWMAMGVAALALLAAEACYNQLLRPTPYDLTVLGQTEWIPDAAAALHIRLLSRDDGRPVPDAPVEVTLDDWQRARQVRLASIKTAGTGGAAPRFRLPDWEDGEYRLKVTALTDRGLETVTTPVQLRRALRLMLSTDKPVYQPGQVIRMRGLALRRPDQKPVAGQEMSFAVTDPKGNVIFRRRVPTSAYGIASADCPLATELTEGLHRLECRVGQTTSRATVEVKTYVLPRFKVALELDRPFYQPGEVVRGTVRADYVFGRPVRDGAVTVAIAATDVLPSPLEQHELKTDVEGRAPFEIRLPDRLVGRPQDDGDARIAITATVRDPAGQSQTRTETRIVSARAIRIEVVPEAGTLVRGQANTVFCLTSTPDGRPVRTRLMITGIGRELRTDGLGLASFEFTPRTDPVQWSIRAIDDDGREGRREVALRCGARTDDFLIRTAKAVYRGGESLRVRALGGGSEPVFVDLIKDGQTALSETIPLADGRGELTVDLPPELSGTVVLCAYRYGAEGVPVRRTRVLHVEPARALTIRTTLDRAEYRPGERARLAIELTDDRGRPAPGAVSLAAVDEAVFAVLAQRPGLEQTFFALEQELLQPVYEVHDWSPHELDEVPPADRDRFEAALFARTADRARIGNEEVSGPVVVHTLAAQTYPEKALRLDRDRSHAINSIRAGWGLLIFVAVGGFVAWMCMAYRGCAVAFAIFVGLVILAFLSLMALVLSGCGDSMFSTVGSALAPTSATPEPAAGAEGAAEPVRVRRWFPETLLWRPELITDDHGRASLDLDLADSITTWRLTAGAVAADGRLGGTQAAIRVFQPFFVDLDLPVALTRGDEVAVPVVVSNYLDRPQEVALVLDDASWFERLDEPERTLELAPGEVRSAHFRLRAQAVGRHELQVTARGEGVADAVRRPIEVVPDGRRVERLVSGVLTQPAEITLEAPAAAIDGSVQAFVKIYPSSFSQLVEGLDAVFQMPSGCFEQTSSTTYPNVLALDYLRRTHKAVPAVEAKARQYIHLGYQRLLSFEIAGGGFDWFGHPPANRTLTAYGLMEFEDMARVHDVDQGLIYRTRHWLLDQRRPDGSWDPEGHMLHDDPTGGRSNEAQARLGTTAYIAWSVFPGFASDAKGRKVLAPTLAFLRGHAPETIDDPYTLALVAHALTTIEPGGEAARPYLERLEALARTSEDLKLSWWEAEPDRRTLFYGAGQGRSIETTALACLALLGADRRPATVSRALSWLIAQKDARGTWHSTQATVLALKSLLAGTGTPLGDDRARRIAPALDGEPLDVIEIPADQDDVLRQVDLSDRVARGARRLTLEDRSGSGSGYQVLFRYHVPDADVPTAEGPLAIRLEYDRTDLAVDDVVTASATVTNRQPAPAPMVLLDLPIPAGFAPKAEDLDELVASGAVSKYQRTARQIVIYLRDLEPGRPLNLRYRLQATMPVKVAVPAARAYEYYDPARLGTSRTARLTVEAR